MSSPNPYDKLLRDMIRMRVIPHRSIPDLVVNWFSKRDIKQSYHRIMIQFFTWMRFALPAAGVSFEVNFTIFGFFNGLPNSRLMNLVLLMLHSIALWMQFCLLHFSTISQFHEGFRMIDSMRRNPSILPSLGRQLHRIGTIYGYINHILIVLFVALFSFDTYRAYWHQSTLWTFVAKMFFFQPLLVMSNIYAFSAAFYMFMFLYVGLDVLKAQYSGLREHLRSRLLPQGYSKMNPILSRNYLVSVSRANRRTMKFSSQSALILSVGYYSVLATLVVLLVLVIDRRTHPLLRAQGIPAAILSFTITCIVFLLFARVNRKAMRLVPLLNHCLVRYAKHPLLCLQIVDTKAQLECGRIGITCLNIFTYTTDKLRRILIQFALNFILAVNLYETYLHLSF